MTECEKLLKEGFITEDFFSEEVKNDHLITEKAKKIWAVELDILNRFIKVCDKYNLKYYMLFGSLLGAIRHNGFIPWDDDVDVAMPRADYDKLLSIPESEFGENMHLVFGTKDKGYSEDFYKLKNSNTTAIISNEYGKVSYNLGIFIDIMPIDFYSEDNKFEKRRYTKMKLINFIQVCAAGRTEHANKYIAFIKRILHFLFKNADTVKLTKKFDDLSKSVKDSKLCGVVAFDYSGGAFGQRRVFPVEYFDNGKEIKKCKFENLEVNVPAEPVKILESLYGSTWQTPLKVVTDENGVIDPHSNSCHTNAIFDPDTPYTYYIEQSKNGKSFYDFA